MSLRASIGANRGRGTWCQQAQDLEYKLSGLQRSFAGKIGSATFPHGAIVLWDLEFLIKTLKHHPGFSVSEDWFFGHVARILGSRITMCSSVFVETDASIGDMLDVTVTQSLPNSLGGVLKTAKAA